MKSIPLWPNFVIIGGQNKTKLWFDSNNNRAIAYDARKENIDNRPLTQPNFDETFVDEQIARISVWWGSDIQKLLRLTDTESVYHGDEVFKLWKSAVDSGITCATKRDLDTQMPEAEKHCVFARDAARGVASEIEYCDFKVDRTSDIREGTICTVVASETRGVRQVLSAHYADWYFEGGESAGEYTCTLPRMSDDDIARIIEGFVQPYIGRSSKYSQKSDEGEHYYKAEGINVFDQNENMFLRVYIFGSYDSWVDKKRGPLSRFTMNANLTISAQASDNIIDYREPNRATADRMRNNFDKALRSYMLTVSKRAACKLD